MPRARAASVSAWSLRALAALAFAACAQGNTVVPAADRGGLNQDCFPNGTCNAPYVCDGGTTCLAQPGERGGRCKGGQCTAPFTCDAATDRCGGPPGLLGGACVDGACSAPFQCKAGLCIGAEGQAYGPCFPNMTCFTGLSCVAGSCEPGGAAGSGGSGTAGGSGTGGAAGTGGTAGTGGISGSGTAGVAGISGQAGASGAGMAGVSGAGTAGAAGAACSPPSHACGSTCEGNTPETGCTQSKDCKPCSAPSFASAVCTGAGACDFECFSGYVKSGGACMLDTGTGGSGGSGGSGNSGSGTAGTGTGGGGTVACTLCTGTCKVVAEDLACLNTCMQKPGCFTCTWDTATSACGCCP